MIAVDTNVLVRIVTNDDPAQAKRAVRALHKQPVFVAKTVLLKMEWVLRYAYGLSRPVILDAMQRLLGLPNVEAEDSASVVQAIKWYAQGLDFADALHLASSGHVRRFLTFDTRLAKRSAKLFGKPVTSP